MRRKLVCMASYVGLVLTLLGRTASAWRSRRLHGTLKIGALHGSLEEMMATGTVTVPRARGQLVGGPEAV